MKIAVIGGNGFLGRALRQAVPCDVVSRQGDLPIERFLQTATFNNYDIIINLAGRPIHAWRWTEATKLAIINSRCAIIDALTETAHKSGHSPWLIQASGISYYGLFDKSIHSHSEHDPPEESNSFMQYVAYCIEKRTKAYPGLSTQLRIAPVFSKHSGALPHLTFLSRAGVHCIPGSGEQTLPWVHVNDFVIACRLILNKKIHGPVNIISPQMTSVQDFYQCIKQHLGGLTINLPPWFYRALLGEMSQLLLLGTKAQPQVLLDHDMRFSYGDLPSALTNLLPPKS